MITEERLHGYIDQTGTTTFNNKFVCRGLYVTYMYAHLHCRGLCGVYGAVDGSAHAAVERANLCAVRRGE